MSTSENHLHPLSNDDTERARHLIPGYLKKTLPADDTAWMAHFLNTLNDHGGSAATALEEEMSWVAHTQAQLAQSTPVFDTQKGWQRMQSRLVAAAPLQVHQAPQTNPSSQPAVTLQRTQALKPSLLTWLKAQLQARIVLTVVFKDDATLLQVRGLLDGVQARVMGSTSAIGVWEVTVPKERLNEAIRALEAAKVVESVAPQ